MCDTVAPLDARHSRHASSRSHTGPMTDEATDRLLGAFVSAIQPVVPLVSVWAHGSLAGGDYQPGRSDLDLIAILSRPCTAA
jgi:hypothetical protein